MACVRDLQGIFGLSRLISRAHRSIPQPNYFHGITGSISAEGCCTSWRIVLVAATEVRPNLISSPVLRLRSKRGKLLLEISRRSEWPRRKTLLVAHRSTEIS